MSRFVIGGKYWGNDRLISIKPFNPHGQKDKCVDLQVSTDETHLFNMVAVKDSLIRLDFSKTEAIPDDISLRLPDGRYATLKTIMNMIEETVA